MAIESQQETVVTQPCGELKKQEPEDGKRASHQRGTPSARLRCGSCRVHVAEEPLNLPQGDTPASVTHLGDKGHVRDPPRLSAPLLTPPPPPMAESRVTYFDGQIFFTERHHDLDGRESEAGLVAFHCGPHGILGRE